jgi:hypothetical protein
MDEKLCRRLFAAFYLAAIAATLCATLHGKPMRKRLTNEECLNRLKPEMTTAEMDEIWRGRAFILQHDGDVIADTGEMYSMTSNSYVWDFNDKGEERLITVVEYGNGTTSIKGPGFSYFRKSPDAKFIRLKLKQ